MIEDSFFTRLLIGKLFAEIVAHGTLPQYSGNLPPHAGSVCRLARHDVQIASRSGTDTAFYQSVCRKLEQNRNKLYEDEVPVRALEAFYRSVVGRLTTEPPTQQ